MKLHADLNQRVVISSEVIPWIDSPMPDVQRRMLERDGEEVARATSIVRYAPNSHFSVHQHGGGEEFFVLEGTFSDEHGDYPAGTYIRNPVGSTHPPFSKDGTILLYYQGMGRIQTNLEHGTLRLNQLPDSGAQLLPLTCTGRMINREGLYLIFFWLW